MRSLPLRLSALTVCLTLASCSSSMPPAIVQPRPLPAALAVSCPPPTEAMNNSADAVAVALKEMYDLYGLCAGRLTELVNYLEQEQLQ